MPTILHQVAYSLFGSKRAPGKIRAGELSGIATLPVEQEFVVANIGVFLFELGNSLQQGFTRPLLGFPIVIVLIRRNYQEHSVFVAPICPSRVFNLILAGSITPAEIYQQAVFYL